MDDGSWHQIGCRNIEWRMQALHEACQNTLSTKPSRSLKLIWRRHKHMQWHHCINIRTSLPLSRVVRTTSDTCLQVQLAPRKTSPQVYRIGPGRQ